MGPVLRSRVAQKSKANNEAEVRKVLGDRTNMSRRTRQPGKKTTCVYSSELKVQSAEEPVNVYDFINTDSPLQDVKKKRKRRRKKSLSDTSDDENTPKNRVKIVLRTKTRQKRNIQPVAMNTESHFSDKESKENTTLEERKENDKKTRQKRNIQPVTVNTESHFSDKESKENTTLEERKENDKKTSLNGSDDNFSIKSPLPLKEKEENTHIEQHSEESPPLQGKYNSTFIIGKNSQRVNESDISHTSSESENKEKSHLKTYRAKCFLSPIEFSQRNQFVNKRRPQKKLNVEDFTVENYFGFEESEDDVSFSMGVPSHLFATSSTPYVKNKPTRPAYQTVRTLSAQDSAARKIVSSGTKLKSSSDEKSSGESSDVPALTFIASRPSEVPTATDACNTSSLPVVIVKSDVASSRSVLCVSHSNKDVPPDTFEVRIKSNQYTTSSKNEAQNGDARIVHPNPSPVLFSDDIMDECFSKPPRKSYERRSRVHRNSHTETEPESEDDICLKRTRRPRKCKGKEDSQTDIDSASDGEHDRKKRTKGTKKRRPKEEVVEKWAANISAQFDEIESFELCVE